MARFLSPSWAEEAQRALRASAEVRAALGTDVTVQYVVRHAPSGEVRYVLRAGEDGIELRLGDAPSPDVEIVEDYETACALARGELKPQAAYMQGRLELTGNMGSFLRADPLLRAAAAVLAGLATEY